jgi:GntR family transcriptional regulator
MSVHYDFVIDHVILTPMVATVRDADDIVLAAVVLERHSPVPLYFQVARQLEAAITAERIPAGTKFDNEIHLAERLGLSRPTIRRAIEYLVGKGLVVRRRGFGTHVVQSTVRRPLRLTSLYDDLEQSGRHPSTRVLSVEIIPATAEVAGALRLELDTPVRAIARLRYSEGQVIARLTNYLPADLLDITTEKLEASGLYQLLRAAGVELHTAGQVIGARTATAAEAHQLDERRGAALLTMERIAFDDSGRAVELGQHIYAASRYNFEINLVGG